MSDLQKNVYNPDVLSCLANLSNEEVFTPPNIVNQMLDLLPQELFRSTHTKFLDPACKSGVFLREIAKRLLKGIEDKIPKLQKRIDHIFQKQLFGIAITELTSLTSRRSVYCSKYPNSRFSVSRFDNPEGNIRFKKTKHVWKKGKCIFCRASQREYDRDESLETHAYEFIHTTHHETIFNMKFDVIIGNPPYQLDTGGAGRQAKPIYNLFVEQAKKLNPSYLCMIIPSRWFAGGMGLESFRKSMINDSHITKIVDYTNSKECFPQNSISGGVCYFLREKNKEDICEFTNINGKSKNTATRRLDEFSIIVRYNEGVSIINKIKKFNEPTLDKITSSLMPYGLSTNIRGNRIRTNEKELILHSSEGIFFIDKNILTNGIDTINFYKILVSKTSSEHAGEPGINGKFRILTSSTKVIGPGEVCTHSYFTIGIFKNKSEANNALSYLKTKFVRFLMLLAMSSINLSKLVFIFIPIQDFSEAWTDEKLYSKYGLTEEEIAFIESMIRPMELNGDSNEEEK